MNNKGIGAVFCLISAILISAKYISAAIFMSGVNTWDATLFAAGLGYVGPFLSIASAVALIVGLLFITNFRLRKPKKLGQTVMVVIVALAVLHGLHIW